MPKPTKIDLQYDIQKLTDCINELLALDNPRDPRIEQIVRERLCNEVTHDHD